MKEFEVIKLEDTRVVIRINEKMMMLTEVEAEYFCDMLETALYDELTYSELQQRVYRLEAEVIKLNNVRWQL